ncbi:hypothetical protein GCM10010365_11230 [Streptomyces poonensis]|uniref:Uncharacterized protein n=1 Tax=Streptomyces poonensis TaxID=68255 RepID=A0A918UE41_9ACTN|nr:hypothetical protein GCM10010365_11230 [Streptomyces poonensis]GLJ87436.1 hypothetical protein GCM10017589_00360 [Streptomyces poonensis]
MIVRSTFRERLGAVVYDYGGGHLLRPAGDGEPGRLPRPAGHAAAVEVHHLTTEQFREGLARMEAAARREALGEPRPVLERYDVAVFSRSWAPPVGGCKRCRPVAPSQEHSAARSTTVP